MNHLIDSHTSKYVLAAYSITVYARLALGGLSSSVVTIVTLVYRGALVSAVCIWNKTLIIVDIKYHILKLFDDDNRQPLCTCVSLNWFIRGTFVSAFEPNYC